MIDPRIQEAFQEGFKAGLLAQEKLSELSAGLQLREMMNKEAKKKGRPAGSGKKISSKRSEAMKARWRKWHQDKNKGREGLAKLNQDIEE